MNNMIDRVVDWNAERYDQVFNAKLQIDLLEEELQEFKDTFYTKPMFYDTPISSENEHKTKHEVDTLDALCDIVFVAVGSMWKMGLNKEQIKAALHTVCYSNESKDVPVLKVDPAIKTNTLKGEGFIPPEPQLQRILNSRRKGTSDE